MLTLVSPVKSYDWGAVDGLAEVAGTDPTGGPEAELWVGAHPAGPSRLDDGRTLDQVVESDARRLLGAAVVERFGPRLPFLLKVLAIGAPLSIQLHPTTDQAEAGYAREEAAGRPRDAPDRTYRDPHAKPELLVAVAPTWVLTGFRTGDDAAARLRGLGQGATAALAERVAGAPDARDALVHILTASESERAALAAAAGAALDDADPVVTWVRRLAGAHPGDPTALAPLLLGLRRLAAGEGVFLPAGVPHAYLEGAGVELMGASDNVVRGGLTSKHVDAEELVALLAPAGTDVVALDGEPVAPGVVRYDPQVPVIALHRLEPDSQGGSAIAAPRRPAGPALALALGGIATVTTAAGEVELGSGRAVLVGPDERDDCTVRGRGTVYWATVGDASLDR